MLLTASRSAVFYGHQVRKVEKGMGAPRLEYALSLYSVLSGNQKPLEFIINHGKTVPRKSYREEKIQDQFVSSQFGQRLIPLVLEFPTVKFLDPIFWI